MISTSNNQSCFLGHKLHVQKQYCDKPFSYPDTKPISAKTQSHTTQKRATPTTPFAAVNECAHGASKPHYASHFVG